jgi:hypothetical protein
MKAQAQAMPRKAQPKSVSSSLISLFLLSPEEA